VTEMTPVEAIFFAALQRPPGDRATFLDAACGGDANLRGRIEKMLAAQPDIGGFLHQPPSRPAEGPAPDRPSPPPWRGAVIAGKYKLLQEVGEGGMGSVWMADQLDPVRRRVAVKLIRADCGRSEDILARFEAERQAIALMDHPHIAKLLDAGTTGDAEAATVGAGRPYFVMELVKGTPLNKYCDEHQLSVPNRLRVFLQICSAVHHAHQKGVIHRDLKPSNILVESHDSKPVPKVIDFGLAKAAGGMRLTENTLFTRVGTVAGTPQYMAPEQATFNALDIDTRADVYALGVILYELLTGTTPLSRETIGKARFEEMFRLIREQDAPAPSSRVSSGESAPSVAANRQTEPARLGRLVRGDLDWIVLKALAKERDRRYESATGFAGDIERFLNHEPVLAGPPGAGYRLRKFVRRNRPQVVAGCLVLMALLAGTAGTTFGLIRAEFRRQEAEDARAQEAEQRRRAETARDKTREVLDAMTAEATGEFLAQQTAISAEQKKFLTGVLAYYQEFAGEQADDEASRERTAAAALRVGHIEYRLGRSGEAAVACRQALDAYARLVADFPAVPAYRQGLANSHTSLAVLLVVQGRPTDAVVQFRAALAINEKLVVDHPAERGYRQDLGASHSNLGTLSNDPEQFRRTLAIREKLVVDFPAVAAYRYEFAITCYNLGNLLREQKQPGKSEEQQRKALPLLEQLVVDFPAVPKYRHALASCHNSLGNVLRDLPGKRGEAEEQYRKALVVREKLAADFPAEPGHRKVLADSHNNLAVVLTEAGSRAGAEDQHRKALAIRERLVADFPGVPGYQLDLGIGYTNLASVVRGGDRPEQSLVWFEKAIGTLSAAYERDRESPLVRRRLGKCYENRASTLVLLRRFTDATKDWDRAYEFSPAANRLAIRVKRASARLNAGLIAEAMEDVAELTKSSDWSADQWYDFAGLCAVASGRSANDQARYADRAMGLLQKAVNAGFKDAARMAKDASLDAVRGRDDFKKLLAGLATRP
jgi:eukaryotic-like serine/threonine-protein kinase